MKLIQSNHNKNDSLKSQFLNLVEGGVENSSCSNLRYVFLKQKKKAKQHFLWVAVHVTKIPPSTRRDVFYPGVDTFWPFGKRTPKRVQTWKINNLYLWRHFSGGYYMTPTQTISGDLSGGGNGNKGL